MKSNYERGAVWRQWDLHIHTPASFHWSGQRFGSDQTKDKQLVDEMIKAMNDAQPSVFALMDYWTFDGWFALKARRQEADCPTLHKTVFPGIELRLAAPTTVRLNAHVIFSDETPDQILKDFQSKLTVEIVKRPLSEAALIELARSVGGDKLKLHGFDKSAVDKDDRLALTAGSTIAELDVNSYKDAIRTVDETLALGFMPYDTSDGLDEVKWQDHYAYFLGLFRSSPIFETRNQTLRAAFVGEKIPENAAWIDNFQKGLNGVPRLAVSGSDAHCFVGNGSNDKRGYGDFPSGKKTWIKADPTFRGLLQAVKEPAFRSFIGEQPPKLRDVDQNKTFYIEKVGVSLRSGSALQESWLNGVSLPLNPDLIAIIGNKGTGKSALADVIALLGNSQRGSHFSFLQKGRFRGKSGEPAKQFEGTLVWCDGTQRVWNLNEDPPAGAVELVKYIPQGHFEELCNAHVTGKTDAFERELRAVIFSHMKDEQRLGALDFDQLIEQQEGALRDRLSQLRKEVGKFNSEIEAIESQQKPEIRNALAELLALKQKQIEEHKKIQPPTPPAPSEKPTPEQEAVAVEVEKLVEAARKTGEEIAKGTTSLSANAAKRTALARVRERLKLVLREVAQFQAEAAADLSLLELKVEDVLKVTVNVPRLDAIDKTLGEERNLIGEGSLNLQASLKSTQDRLAELKLKLDAPQLKYQEDLKLVSAWQAKLTELIGTPEVAESLKGLEVRLEQLNSLPTALVNLVGRRREIAGEIFDALNAQRLARERLFSPVQELIANNSLVREEYRLKFEAKLGGSVDMLSSELFGLIKQNAGEFRGDDESFSAVRRIADQFDLSTRTGVLAFAESLDKKIHEAATGPGIGNVLRKDRSASTVYDLVFGLRYLEPRYSLLFQDTHIEQLSPGQRGALLLIFYLLVDKGRQPIILDQPEENLDNETVVSLLVPVLTEAKKRRQIVMVTHNPNLAVVCDAEQVIYSTFDRKAGSAISYTSGAIEDPGINKRAVDVLEGTKRAFNNRGGKWQ